MSVAIPLCEEHSSEGGARSACVICSGLSLQAALSRIDYLCGEPNEMGVSGYDVHCSEEEVVKRVELTASLLKEAVEIITEEYPLCGEFDGCGKCNIVREFLGRAAKGIKGK